MDSHSYVNAEGVSIIIVPFDSPCSLVALNQVKKFPWLTLSSSSPRALSHNWVFFIRPLLRGLVVRSTHLKNHTMVIHRYVKANTRNLVEYVWKNTRHEYKSPQKRTKPIKDTHKENVFIHTPSSVFDQSYIDGYDNRRCQKEPTNHQNGGDHENSAF